MRRSPERGHRAARRQYWLSRTLILPSMHADRSSIPAHRAAEQITHPGYLKRWLQSGKDVSTPLPDSDAKTGNTRREADRASRSLMEYSVIIFSGRKDTPRNKTASQIHHKSSSRLGSDRRGVFHTRGMGSSGSMSTCSEHFLRRWLSASPWDHSSSYFMVHLL